MCFHYCFYNLNKEKHILILWNAYLHDTVYKSVHALCEMHFIDSETNYFMIWILYKSLESKATYYTQS